MPSLQPAVFDGFRILARTTPMNGDQIKTNETAASEGGLKRLGVLRMDVDNLGDLIVRGLQRARHARPRTESGVGALLRRLAGSHLLSNRPRPVYVLFAGGDDLFVVGPWTYMPMLAQAIRDDFARYTGGIPASISPPASRWWARKRRSTPRPTSRMTRWGPRRSWSGTRR